MFGCHPAVKSRNAMMPCEWWSMYGTDCEVLQRLAVRVLAQTVSSSPCERNWSTFSLIHTNKRNRIGYERLQKLVYCHYNMKLRERLLLSEGRRKAQEDLLDLMTVGQHAYAEDAEDDLVYQWVRSDDLDTSDGRPEPHIAVEVEIQGIDVDKHVEQQRSPYEAFDLLTRSPKGSPRQSLSRETCGGETLSDTETESESDAGNEFGDDDGGDKGDNDSDDSKDDDDDDGGGDGDGGDVGGSQDKRPLSPFTGKENFDHSTQDPDHGSRPGEPRPRLVYNKTYTRQKLLQKKKTHKLSDFEEELLAKCMRDTSVRGRRGGSRFGSRTRGARVIGHNMNMHHKHWRVARVLAKPQLHWSLDGWNGQFTADLGLDTNNHKPALVRNCGCGSACKCGSGCGGCKMYPDFSFSFSGETTTTETMIVRVTPQKGYFEGFEMNDGSENGGCKCRSNCTYDPCTCK
ncbi:uncharacterized protein LOC131244630 [Magnolia sinica]|uniref:uncharacterized protein LOC131244630 n=1 Tax=Magnolia sinica TaxID=86752 RepID=UPI00265A878F|nr:uncharacterized protein LOC131244630 [Magnolia sinica]